MTFKFFQIQFVDINLVGVFLGMHYAVPSMRKGDGGAIINISSIASLRGPLGRVAYAGTKGAVDAMTHDGLTNPFTGKQMINEASEVSNELDASRVSTLLNLGEMAWRLDRNAPLAREYLQKVVEIDSIRGQQLLLVNRIDAGRDRVDRSARRRRDRAPVDQDDRTDRIQ